VAQVSYYYPLLPERIALLFWPSVRPDAWSARTAIITFYCIVVGILFLLFPTISFALSKIPISCINLPTRSIGCHRNTEKKTFDYLSS